MSLEHSPTILEFATENITRPPLGELQYICDLLNRVNAGWVLELRRLIQDWRSSGPNLIKMLEADPALYNKLKDDFSAVWLPSESGRSFISFNTRASYTDPHHAARVFFVRITLSPEWDKMGGPCLRCQRFYIKQRISQTSYCSRRCGNAATAALRTRQRLDTEHIDKLTRSKQDQIRWKRDFKNGRTKIGWKEFVSARHPDISVKFLTRAVNKGELSGTAE